MRSFLKLIMDLGQVGILFYPHVSIIYKINLIQNLFLLYIYI